MVAYGATKIITTCSPMIAQFFFTSLLSKSYYNDPSKSKSWKGLETVLSQLKINGTCSQREVYLSSKFAINDFQRTSRVSIDEHKRGIQCTF